MRVLIIESDKTLAAQLKAFLEADGHEVLAVLYNGMAALQALNHQSPELIFLDLHLPNHWAETILHAINKRNIEQLRLVICAQQPENARYAMQRHRQAAFLQKPVSKSELHNLLASTTVQEPFAPYLHLSPTK